MQRSSSLIAGLAVALAKAQADLVNAEKSQVATIRSEAGRGPNRPSLCAPLKRARYRPEDLGPAWHRKKPGDRDQPRLSERST
jgi:hypothetical protein